MLLLDDIILIIMDFPDFNKGIVLKETVIF